MKLSEAIREGSKIRPQIRGKGDFGFNEFRQICSCAMGAAFEATGLVNVIDTGLDWPVYAAGPTITLDKLFELWPVLNVMVDSPVEPCDMCYPKVHKKSVARIITHINDYHDWTREQIADWVESIENGGM